ncbi:MAG: serine hydrolase [Bryobacteraceae bacterium]
MSEKKWRPGVRPMLAVFLLFLAGSLSAGQAPEALNPDSGMQQALEAVLQKLGLQSPAREHRLALSLVDVSDPSRVRYAGINDRDMMYAASLPKIAILLAGFEAIGNGLLRYTPDVKAMFTRLTRFSSNEDASRAVQRIGFDYIAQVLTSTRYKLYDPASNGGLWIGKAYGGPADYWKRDPLHNLSHGATSLQVARFFVMLDQGKLVSPHYSAEMKEILSNPGIHHKFVKGLETARPGRVIYRKSGTWRDTHCDAALVEYGGRKYIAVALMKDEHGGEVLPRLIVQMDDLVINRNHVLAANHASAPID